MKNYLYEALNTPPKDNYPEVRHLINSLAQAHPSQCYSICKQIADYAKANYDDEKITSLIYHIDSLLYWKQFYKNTNLSIRRK